jgi:ankyrin repeat protein
LDNVARAAAANDATTVRQMVSDHNPNQVDDEGRTGLLIAATNGNMQIAAILIKAGANLAAKDKLGNTPLHLAGERNQVEMAQLLIDVGAPVDADNRMGMTPLMVASSRGNAAIVQALLAKGANPRKTDFTGRDALSWATDSRRGAWCSCCSAPPRTADRGEAKQAWPNRRRSSTRFAPCWRTCRGRTSKPAPPRRRANAS